MKVYKVVRYNGVQLRSMFAAGEHCVTYEPGVETIGPHGTPLLAFDWLHLAKQWAKDHCGQVWEAEAVAARPVSVLSGGNSLGYLAFWHAGDRFRGPIIPAPLGTVACEKITLTKRVT